MIKKLLTALLEGSIAKKLTLTVIMISSFSMITTTVYLSYDEYNSKIQKVKDTFEHIKKGHNLALTQSLWTFDIEQIDKIMEGILTYPDISYVKLETKDLSKFIGEINPENENLEYIIPLEFQDHKLGSLIVISDLTEAVMKETKELFIQIFISQFVQTIFIIVLILIFINKILLKPLTTLNNYTNKLKDLRHTTDDLAFDKLTATEFINQAELINEMKKNNVMNFNRIEEQNHELAKYQEDLEELVKKRTDQLKSAVIKAQEASKVKSQFISNMSHELRTPLNSIILLSELTASNQDKNLTSIEVKNINIINNAGQDLLYLVNDILDLSKLEAGKLNYKIEKFNLNDVLNDVFNLLHFQAESKNIEVNYINPMESFITSDPNRLAQVVKNVMGNAIKFTEKGHVNLTLNKSPKEGFEYRFTITDTGPGIKKEHLSRIFNRFEQVEEGETRNHSGSGLGLFISRTILDGLCCEMEVSSEYGVGTTFDIDVKSVKADAKSTSSTSAIYSGHDEFILKDKNVILVDDDDINLYSMESFLESKGAIVKTFQKPADLIQILEEDLDVDYFFLDYMMPEISGDKLTLEIIKSKKYSDIPVYILTAAVDKDVHDKCILSGALGVLSKPLNWKELANVIQSQQ